MVTGRSVLKSDEEGENDNNAPTAQARLDLSMVAFRLH